MFSAWLELNIVNGLCVNSVSQVFQMAREIGHPPEDVIQSSFVKYTTHTQNTNNNSSSSSKFTCRKSICMYAEMCKPIQMDRIRKHRYHELCASVTTHQTTASEWQRNSINIKVLSLWRLSFFLSFLIYKKELLIREIFVIENLSTYWITFGREITGKTGTESIALCQTTWIIVSEIVNHCHCTLQAKQGI